MVNFYRPSGNLMKSVRENNFAFLGFNPDISRITSFINNIATCSQFGLISSSYHVFGVAAPCSLQLFTDVSVEFPMSLRWRQCVPSKCWYSCRQTLQHSSEEHSLYTHHRDIIRYNIEWSLVIWNVEGNYCRWTDTKFESPWISRMARKLNVSFSKHKIIILKSKLTIKF